MGMTAQYYRLSQSRLEAILSESGAFPDIDYKDKTCYLDIDKAWHIIHFLLNADEWEGPYPLSHAVLGGEPIGDDDGEARYLTSSNVQDVSNALDKIDAADLLSHWDQQAIEAANIYPVWNNEPEEHEYITHHYEALRAFFKSAARDGLAMLVRII